MATNIKLVEKLAKKLHGTHKFLAEELLVPLVNHCDGMRITMFDAHLTQTKVLVNPDFPNVFTNFENQIGKYSTSYKRSEGKWKIIGKFKKNDMNTLFILRDKDYNVKYILTKYAERITERYGYKYNNYIEKKKVNDIIEDNEVMYASTTYDKNMNFCYGVNLKACFLSYDNRTYEDSILIRKGALEKLDSYSPDEIIITINTNDILLNLYGDNDEYKCFADIGETTNSTILAARRRISYESILFDLNNTNIKKANLDTDTFFFVGSPDSIIYDIDVFCNSNIENLRKLPYYKQILKYYDKNMSYYKRVINFLEKLLNNEKYKCSNDVKYIYRRYKDIIDENSEFKYDGNTFDNIVLKIKTLSKKHLTVGMKITGRYGSKGVIGGILEDDEMPRNQYGEVADVCLNPIGVIGRLNLAQLIEQDLNFHADNIVRKMKEMDDNDDRFNYMITFYDIVNPKQAKFLRNKWKNYNDDEKENFMNECFTYGLFIHEPPFFGNVSLDDLLKLYDTFNFEPYKCNINGKEIETPLIFGNIYYLLLKHDPSSKFSARSAGDLSINNIPSKSNSFKYHTSIFSKTPVRCGEMEFGSLLLTQKIDLVMRYMAQTSTNPEERTHFSKELLISNPFNIEKINMVGSKSITSQITRMQLLTIGLINKPELEEEDFQKMDDVAKLLE